MKEHASATGAELSRYSMAARAWLLRAANEWAQYLLMLLRRVAAEDRPWRNRDGYGLIQERLSCRSEAVVYF